MQRKLSLYQIYPKFPLLLYENRLLRKICDKKNNVILRRDFCAYEYYVVGLCEMFEYKCWSLHWNKFLNTWNDSWSGLFRPQNLFLRPVFYEPCYYRKLWYGKHQKDIGLERKWMRFSCSYMISIIGMATQFGWWTLY